MASSLRTLLFTLPPPLPGLLMTPRFWPAHLNHACTRAVSPLGGAGTTDNMAGDQLAIWNQVNMHNNEPIPSTQSHHLCPPRSRCFILANLKAAKGSLLNSAQLSPLNLTYHRSSPLLNVLTSIYPSSSLKMRT